jgi:hypothetical protein
MPVNTEEIEQTARQMSPIVLLILGIAAVVVGLFFWLGGLKFKKILLPATGLIAGGTIGLFAFQKGVMAILISVVFCVILGIVLEIIFERKLGTKGILSRLVIALLFSAAGTVIIFTGMIVLLIYKGGDPLGEIEGRRLFYAAVFAGMTIFGMVMQSILCRRQERGLEDIKRKEG